MNLWQSHLVQAERNEQLHAILVTNEPGRFFDWKIVALFYAALHYLKALSSKRNIYIGDTHYDIDRNCNPDRPGAIMPLNKDAWSNYRDLLTFSKESRYNVTNEEVKKDYIYCLGELSRFKEYIKAQGLPIKM